jgi:hypothetical protein
MDVEGIDPVAAYAALMSTLVRTVFAEPDAASAWAQDARVVDQLAERFPAAAELLADATADLLAFTAFPKEHCRQTWVQHPQERLNGELAERVYRPEVCSCSKITSGPGSSRFPLWLSITTSQDSMAPTARHARNRLIKLPFGFGIRPFDQAGVHYRHRVELSNS